MKLGRRYDPQEIVFSLEKPSPSSSSSSSFVDPSSSSSSSASQPSSSSSSASSSSSSSTSAGCGPFNFTLNTTLGANLDFPDQYFGEAVGVNIISGDGVQLTLGYDNLDVAGPAFRMQIQIDGQLVAGATVAIGLEEIYIGKPFSLTRLGVTYCGTFTEGTVILG